MTILALALAVGVATGVTHSAPTCIAEPSGSCAAWAITEVSRRPGHMQKFWNLVAFSTTYGLTYYVATFSAGSECDRQQEHQERDKYNDHRFFCVPVWKWVP